MNILGIGPMEMGVIAVIALLIFGPSKLPEVMGQAGKWVGDFRKMTAGFTGEFEKTMAEAREITGGITSELGGMSKQVNSVSNSVKKDLAGSKKSTTAAKSTTTTRAGAKSTTSATTKSATGKSTTAATTSAAKKTTTAAKPAKPPVPVASRDDPTADFSLFEPDIVERPKRTRTAAPAAIQDLLPREIIEEVKPVAAVAATDSNADDPLERARQRRRNAGYGRVSA
ncbi:MAG: twin-arginine translocase TatA/TatE family subunit [Thermomicrobiales bacterium]